mmetsp:Transcript_110131/g.246161  ORF Transcript_110131/g.246161 Transcript_110131/m.246161 type:complete len:193 (+) Transcript_110131:76-654(+)
MMLAFFLMASLVTESLADVCNATEESETMNMLQTRTQDNLDVRRDCSDGEMTCINRSPARTFARCYMWARVACRACDPATPAIYMRECPLTDLQRQRQDGCSGPLADGQMLAGFGRIFKPACDLHDSCYSTCGMTKSACDDEFNINLAALCQSETTGLGNDCFKWAVTAVTAVRVAGAAQVGYDLGQEAANC